MSKYNNTKIEVDGIVFDSKKEAKYYKIFKDAAENGEISNLRRQVSFEIIPAVKRQVVKHLKTKDKLEERCVQRATHYVADFVYTDPKTKLDVVVDVKSPITRKNPVYILKKKMMLAFNNIEIVEM